MGLIVLLVVQGICAAALLLHVVLQLDLARHAVRRRLVDAPRLPDPWPSVTVQLPIYNERHLAERAIGAISALDYPSGRLEIQVLDDSTDDTPALIAHAISERAARGVPIRHLRRPSRAGYKAGALAHGLETATGELVVIFDVDFVPDPDFLRRVVPFFADRRVAAVQSRWGYLNRGESLLTRAQALILDNHFGVEQAGRANAGGFTTFNGSGGVWRASAIRDAGGWSAETLTEDLDLSYRAQLRGWHLRYLDDVVTPSELPADLRSYRVQQYRWIKGTAQNAREHLVGVLQAPMPPELRLHAAAHLLESSVYVAILGLVLTTAALAAGRAWDRIGAWPFIHPGVLLGAVGLLVVYYVSQRERVRGPVGFLTYLGTWAAFFVLTTGMVVHNASAVVAGYLGPGGEFVRTPKAASYTADEEPAEPMPLVPWVLFAEIVAWVVLVAVVTSAVLAGQAPMVWLLGVTLIGLTPIIVGELATSGAIRDAATAVGRAVRRVVGGEAS